MSLNYLIRIQEALKYKKRRHVRPLTEQLAISTNMLLADSQKK